MRRRSAAEGNVAAFRHFRNTGRRADIGRDQRILARLAQAFPALADDACGIAFASGRRGHRGQEANVSEKSVHDGSWAR